MTGLIAKALRGAAAAGVPALLEEARAQNQAKRDALLQQFTKENMAAQQQFQASERLAGQEFTGAQNAENRAFQAEQSQLTRDQQQRQFDATLANQREQFRAGLGIDLAKLDVLVKQAEQALEQGELGLIQSRRVESLRSTLVDPNATEDQIKKAAEQLSTLLGEGDSYSAITAYGDPDEFGQQTRSTGILNRRTGQVMPFGGSSNVLNWADLDD